MKLENAIDHYISWRQTHGAKFISTAGLLHRFVKCVDGKTDCDGVTTKQVLRFLAGDGPLTRLRENKYYALTGFYRYAISRGYARHSPLPDSDGKSLTRTPPYIYSRDELRRLFDADVIEVSRQGAVQLNTATFRTLLLLLYGAGLRYSEATGLTLANVDLAENVLTINATKFYKSRLVPIGPQLTAVLASYMPQRPRSGIAQRKTSFFLTNRNGTRLASSTVQAAFDALRRVAGVDGKRSGRRVPRLHDFRHNSEHPIIPSRFAATA